MALSIEKVGISTTPGSKTPEPIGAPKVGVSNYVGELTLTSKYGSNRSTWVYGRMRPISLFVTIGLPIHCNYQLAHYTGFCRIYRSILNRFQPNLQA